MANQRSSAFRREVCLSNSARYVRSSTAERSSLQLVISRTQRRTSNYLTDYIQSTAILDPILAYSCIVADARERKMDLKA